MRCVPLLLAALCGLIPSVSAGEERPQPPELTVAKLAKAPPKIDGVLDDQAWKEASRIEKFFRPYGMESETKCRLYITYDDHNLYLAVECPEPEEQMPKLKAKVTQHNGDRIWEDDSVEFFIDPTGGHGFPYYHIMVNCIGVTSDGFVAGPQKHDISWEPKYQAKAAAGKEGWTLEMALPWECFDRTESSAAEWNFNFFHERSIGEKLFWSPVYCETTHTPSAFGRLKGMPVRPLGKK